MEVRHYLRILRRRAWIVLAVVVAMVSITAVLTYSTQPQYTAMATVFIKNQSSGGGPALSFQEVATSNTVILHARSELHLTEDVDSVRQRIKISGDQNSNLYRVVVTEASPVGAVALANIVAQEASKTYRQLAGGTVGAAVTQETLDNKTQYLSQYLASAQALVDFERRHPELATPSAGPAAPTVDPGVRAEHLRLQLEERASGGAYTDFQSAVVKSKVEEISNARNIDARVIDEAAAKPDTSGRSLKVLYAAALAVVVGVALAFGIEYMDKSVRDPDEVEQLIGAPVIGLIPRGNQRSLRQAKGSS